MTETLDVSIVVPTLGRPLLAAALSRALEDLNPQPREVIFVFQREHEELEFTANNPSSNATTVLASEPSLALARNLGAARSSSTFIAFLDDDCSPNGEDWLLQIVDPLRSNRIGLVTGSVTGWTKASGRIPGLNRAFLLAPPFLQPVGTSEATRSAACHTVCGGNFACRRDDFERLGGFHPSFGKHSLYEDIEFSLRMRRTLGCEIWYSADASVHHNQQEEGGVRTERYIQNERWVTEQKALLLQLVYGHGASFRLRLGAYRTTRAAFALMRKVKAS